MLLAPAHRRPPTIRATICDTSRALLVLDGAVSPEVTRRMEVMIAAFLGMGVRQVIVDLSAASGVPADVAGRPGSGCHRAGATRRLAAGRGHRLHGSDPGGRLPGLSGRGVPARGAGRGAVHVVLKRDGPATGQRNARPPSEPARRAGSTAPPVSGDAWTVVFDGWEPADEGRREALCTLGNGRFATRGAAPESVADGVHYPGTYAAGCYNRLRDEVGGQTVENESAVNLPNWLDLRFAVDDGEWVDLAGGARAAPPRGARPAPRDA